VQRPESGVWTKDKTGRGWHHYHGVKSNKCAAQWGVWYEEHGRVPFERIYLSNVESIEERRRKCGNDCAGVEYAEN
jgi:hypothetical protein